jgi:hypothetical protein
VADSAIVAAAIDTSGLARRRKVLTIRQLDRAAGHAGWRCYLARSAFIAQPLESEILLALSQAVGADRICHLEALARVREAHALKEETACLAREAGQRASAARIARSVVLRAMPGELMMCSLTHRELGRTLRRRSAYGVPDDYLTATDRVIHFRPRRAVAEAELARRRVARLGRRRSAAGGVP